jgi:hypothetical protein
VGGCVQLLHAVLFMARSLKPPGFNPSLRLLVK